MEYDPHGEYGILSYVWDDDMRMEDQVKHLKARVKDLEIYARNTMRTTGYLKGDFLEWDIVLPSHFPYEFEGILIWAWNWSVTWGGSEITALTKEQKERVITSLDGYIVQEDFDSIHGRLHPDMQARFLETLTEAFLNKTVIDLVFRNPFWYVDEDCQVDDNHEGVTWDGISPLGEKLGKLHERFQQGAPPIPCPPALHANINLKVENEYAQVWRSVTTRLCNSTRMGQTRNFNFGKATQARRNAKCEVLARSLLENETLLCLLKPTEDIDQREGNLVWILQHIAQKAVDMLAQTPVLGFKTMSDLGDRFEWSSDTFQSLPFCWAQPHEGKSRLDGQRVLGITCPYVFRTVNCPEYEKEIELVHKAKALIEENPPGKERPAKKPKV